MQQELVKLNMKVTVNASFLKDFAAHWNEPFFDPAVIKKVGGDLFIDSHPFTQSGDVWVRVSIGSPHSPYYQEVPLKDVDEVIDDTVDKADAEIVASVTADVTDDIITKQDEPTTSKPASRQDQHQSEALTSERAV